MRNESMNLSKNEMMMVMHDQEQEIENSSLRSRSFRQSSTDMRSR